MFTSSVRPNWDAKGIVSSAYHTVEEKAEPDTRYAQAANAVMDEVAGKSVKFHWEPSAFPRRLRYLLFR